jgi:hypothetical protein
VAQYLLVQQKMAESWSLPFLDAFGAAGKVQVYEVFLHNHCQVQSMMQSHAKYYWQVLFWSMLDGASVIFSKLRQMGNLALSG